MSKSIGITVDVAITQLKTMGFPHAVTKAVALMMHRKEISCFAYVKAIKRNDIPRRVNLSDLAHNSNLSRLNAITEKDLQGVKKYKKAIEMLNT